MVVQLIGGIGLFLLGMMLMSDGLKSAAGEALRKILVRFTGTPLHAFGSGLVVTALVQSSSATTLATIGFVSAGLLTFAQAIGVVIGSSVGTTTTGWLVAFLGLKLSVGKLALPLIGAGALMKLTLRGRPAAIGLALAGFGLIFVGIETLQTGMSGLAESFRPDSFPAPDWKGRAILLMIGLLMTVIMQSSSAAIATVITAFYTGTIDLHQSLSLVIGASIGTTVTAALACIGASTAAKRTAVCHILFNSFAGCIGFVLEPFFVGWVESNESAAASDGATVLALFHTSFNVVAACLVLPLTARWAALITKLIPEHGPQLTRYLDDSVRNIPEVAQEAVRRTLLACSREMVGILRDSAVVGKDAATNVGNALVEVRRFLAETPASVTGEPDFRLNLVHALDHLDQLAMELSRPRQVMATGEATERIAGASTIFESLLNQVLLPDLEDAKEIESAAGLAAASAELAAIRREGRDRMLKDTAAGLLPVEQVMQVLDQLRWMDTVGYHIWRTMEHLCAGGPSQTTRRLEDDRESSSFSP